MRLPWSQNWTYKKQIYKKQNYKKQQQQAGEGREPHCQAMLLLL